jgi:hypothetical protein
MSGKVRRVWPIPCGPVRKPETSRPDLKGGVGDLSAVEGFQAIAGGVDEGDQARHAALVSQRGEFTFHGDAGGFEAGGERVKCRGVGDFPAEDLGARYEGPVDK